MGNNNLVDSIEKLINSGYFGEDIVNILYKAKHAATEVEKLRETKDQEIEELKSELDKQKEIQAALLREMIGKKIYWACPGWKIEEHVITNVEYRVYDSDFFDWKDKKYKGKKCVVIDVDNDGNYLADLIGERLFFSTEEAVKSLSEINK